MYEYCYRIPIINLENAKGIPANYLLHLEKQLNELANKIIGEVMVFELVQYVQVTKTILLSFRMSNF